MLVTSLIVSFVQSMSYPSVNLRTCINSMPVLSSFCQAISLFPENAQKICIALHLIERIIYKPKTMQVHPNTNTEDNSRQIARHSLQRTHHQTNNSLDDVLTRTHTRTRTTTREKTSPSTTVNHNLTPQTRPPTT